MPIRIQFLQHIVYKYRGPVWVDNIDPVWIIIVAPLGHTEIAVSYSDSTFGYIQIEITVSYSDSTFGYIRIKNSDSTFGYIQFFSYPLIRY